MVKTWTGCRLRTCARTGWCQGVCARRPSFAFQYSISKKMVSTRGFEPPTPGFIPLRLSPPLARSWSGLSLHHEPKPLGAARPVSTHFPEFLRGLARDWHAGSPAKRPPTLSGLIAKVSQSNPQLRNPVLYPAELRGPEDIARSSIAHPICPGNRKLAPPKAASVPGLGQDPAALR